MSIPKHPTNSSMTPIFLQEIIRKLSQATPDSRVAMIMYCRKILATDLLEVIDTHNTASVLFIISQESSKYVLKVEYGQNNATAGEVTWYRTVKDREPRVAPICLASCITKSLAFLVLEYVDAKTLEDIMEADVLSQDMIRSHIRTVLSKDRLLFEDSSSPLSLDEMDIFFVRKFRIRQKEAANFAYLHGMFNQKTVRINDRELLTPAYCIDTILNDGTLHQRLTPQYAGLIHGDLHCGNILVTPQGTTYFVDPNGSSQMPLEYDYGKLLHSVHGLYGQIMRNKYSLESLGEYSFKFTLNPGRSYTAALHYIQEELSTEEMLRSLYAEALHFATMLPHHASQKQETTALFLRSTELFAELFERIGIRV